MRLLEWNSDSEISLTKDFTNNIPRYAILSHTWGLDTEEVTFGDLSNSTGKSKAGYNKIRFCGEQAKRDGLQFFWVDTCCIDRSSSAELTEAINSMFRWYQEAAKCYVYLPDVSKGGCADDNLEPAIWKSAFRKSLWFTRGWTLQELIAPVSVEFFSREGERLGDKRLLEQQVNEITGIPVQALRGIPLSEFSVTERMSWAVNRQTTRKEDRAYSLLGIFDIHIPLIYGEGEKAFLRLKEEIDKHLDVQSQSKVQHWLSPSNVADDLQKHVEECMPGSCDWLLTCPSMQSFLSSGNSTLGHIQGRPGAGKSTMLGFVVKHLLSYRGPIVAYFFCKANDPEKRQPIHVLRTILSQLLRADEQLYPTVKEIYIRSGRAVADCYTEVEESLAVAFANLRNPQTFIIIDALDECQDVPKLLESIRRCMRSARSTTRVLIASRPIALDVLPDYQILIDNVQSSAAFIEKYIAQRVNANNNIRMTKLGRRVISDVFDATDGLWLYARLMMDEIERLASSALIERQLQTIPRGITRLYTQILRSTEQHFSSEQIGFAQQIFLWLDVDDYLPEFLVTDYEGLSHNTLSRILQYVNYGQSVFDPITLARELCFPLVEVHGIALLDDLPFQGSNPRRSATHTRDIELDYVHHTAKQYILASSASPWIDLPLVLRLRRFRHFHRAAVSVWYFSECSGSEMHLRSLRANPNMSSGIQCYFDMTYGIWGALKLSEFESKILPEEISELTFIIHKLSNFITSIECFRWIETAIIINYSAGYYHLLLNATEAFEAALHADTHGVTVWKEYQDARLRFLSTFVYVLGLTGPPLPSSRIDYKYFQSNVSDSDPLAREILKLGKFWQQQLSM